MGCLGPSVGCSGRIAHAPEFVYRTADRLRMAVSARRLEIGAGTGQLTGALLAAGGELVVVEPSGPMAERLRLNRAADVVISWVLICPGPADSSPRDGDRRQTQLITSPT